MTQAAKKLNVVDLPQAKKDYEYNWRVLIVEDEPAIAEGIKAIIAPAPAAVVPINRSSRSAPPNKPAGTPSESHKDQFEVVWAKNPTEALHHIKQSILNGKPFAMGFFDVLLGSEIDGIELVRQIHLMDPKIHAVFVTAYHDRTVDSINQILGANKSDRWDYMNKPFTDGAILQKARNAVAMWNLKEQKKLQDEQLSEASQLLRQNERNSTVAAVGRSVAHEFGNLLMHIVGHAEIALMKGDLAQMRNALTTILKAGETASSVLSKFKKMNNVEVNPELVNIKLNASIDEAIDLMAHDFNKRNIKVTKIKYHQVEIEANHHSLVQVFINLFTNAAYVMSPSGQIDISVAKCVNPEGDKPDSWVEIKVRDHGPGIPQDVLPYVMNPFYTTKGNKGTGLGLPICKEIIEAEHLGEFSLANHPAKGVEVTIKVPIKQEE
ncbi:MAG: ATP-binding protein [Pseudobdellovibrio sp.]|nr:ATP-binding protein [Pseudobdellovibrio sp.]